MSKLSSLLLLCALLTVSCGTGKESEKRSTTGSSLNAGSAKTVMPVTFPDGSSADLIHSEDLPLSRFVTAAWTWGRLPGCCWRDIRIRRADDGVTRPEFGVTGQPVKTFEGADGSEVGLWRAPGHTTRYNLVFVFGAWMVAVASDNGGEQMNDAQLATWARSLHGRVARTGFIVLSAQNPLELADTGDAAGPEITFDDALPGQPRIISIIPGKLKETTPPQDIPRGFRSWVADEGFARVHAQGDEVFLKDLPRRLQVTNVKLVRR